MRRRLSSRSRSRSRCRYPCTGGAIIRRGEWNDLAGDGKRVRDVSVHDRDMWLDTAGGRAFTAMHGGRDQAKAALAAKAQAEAQAIRDKIDEFEIAYNRRPPVDQVRYHPEVHQDAGATLSGDSRQIRTRSGGLTRCTVSMSPTSCPTQRSATS